MGTTLTRVMNDNAADRRRERRELAREGRATRVNVGRGERLFSTVLGGLLTVYGLRRRDRAGYGLAAVGAELLYRGATGHCHAYGALGVSTDQERIAGTVADVDHSKSVDVRHSIEVARPREELYAAWRNFSNLPGFMTHLERVDVLSNTKSHWVTKGPAGMKVEWDAEIVDERENEWIAWQAVEPAQVPNNGTVMFRDAPSGDTEIFVTLEAQPPAGKLGELVARMFGKSPDRQVRMALEKFKEMAESGHAWEVAGMTGNVRGTGSSTIDREVALSGESTNDGGNRGNRGNSGLGDVTGSTSRQDATDTNDDENRF
ncbi:MAG: SRPBCC family protein [Gemmatimonadota bacterium]